MSFTKKAVSFKEFKMHEYIYQLSQEPIGKGILHVPRIIHYDIAEKILVMEDIGFMNLADFYGEAESNIEPSLFARIREIIKLLYNNHIVYPDITGYNFIEKNSISNGSILWLIDFGHADFKTLAKDTFVEKFISDEKYNRWNPWYKWNDGISKHKQWYISEAKL